MADAATVLSIIAMAMAPVAGAGGAFAGHALAWRRFKHEVTQTEWQDYQESFDKQIALAVDRGDQEGANRIRHEFEGLLEAWRVTRDIAGQLEAWRATQQIEDLAPRTISEEGVPRLSQDEVERLQALLTVSERLNPAALSAEDFYLRGNALYDSEQYAEALAAYDRALALRPDYQEAHNSRGLALRRVGRNEEALAAYDRALALWPDYPNAHNNRGVALQMLGRHEEALEAYDRALTLRPDYQEAIYNKAWVYSELGNGPAALEWLERAIDADETNRTDARNATGFNFCGSIQSTARGSGSWWGRKASFSPTTRP